MIPRTFLPRRRSALLGLSALAAAAAAPPLRARTPDVTLRLHHYVPAASFPHTRFLAPWAETIERESDGRIRVQIAPAMQLGGTVAQLYDQVRDGVVDLVWTMPGATPGRFPRTEIFELPFVATDAASTNLALQDYFAAHLRDEFREVHVLLLHTNDGLVVHANRPIRRLEDYAGLRVRAPNRAGTLYLRAVGASPVGAPIGEVPQMLSKGIIDGTLISHEIALPLRVHELVNHHSDLAGDRRVQSPLFMLAMNRRRYESLPGELRQVIDRHSGVAIARQTGETFIAVERIGMEAARQRGNTFVTMPAQEVARVQAVVHEAIDAQLAEMATRGLDAQRLHRDAREMVERHAARRAVSQRAEPRR